MVKKVYIYLVLFVTLMMVIGGSVGIFMALADIIAPTPYYQSFEEYKRWGNDKPSLEGDDSINKELSDEELKKEYDIMVQEQNDMQIARAKNSLIKSLGWIIIPLPVFIFFQRRLAKQDN